MSLLLENYQVLHSHDADDVCDRVGRAYCDHSLKPRSAGKRLDTRYHRASFGDVSFNYLQYGADVDVAPAAFGEFLMLEIPLSGLAKIYYGDDVVCSAPGVGSVVSSSKPVRSQWSADARRLMVQIDRNSLENYATDLLGHRLTQPIEFRLDLQLDRGIGMGLTSYISHVVDQLTHNDMYDQFLIVRQQVSRTIFAMLLNGHPHNYSREITAVATPGAPRDIERAYQYIMEHFDEDISIERLTQITGVSKRSLYEGFKRYKGISPMLALKNRRLEAAHEDLLQPGSSVSVTEVALKWGFSHLGNFAKDYQRRFHCYPSETRKKTIRENC